MSFLIHRIQVFSHGLQTCDLSGNSLLDHISLHFPLNSSYLLFLQQKIHSYLMAFYFLYPLPGMFSIPFTPSHPITIGSSLSFKSYLSPIPVASQSLPLLYLNYLSSISEQLIFFLFIWCCSVCQSPSKHKLNVLCSLCNRDQHISVQKLPVKRMKIRNSKVFAALRQCVRSIEFENHQTSPLIICVVMVVFPQSGHTWQYNIWMSREN